MREITKEWIDKNLEEAFRTLKDIKLSEEAKQHLLDLGLEEREE